MAGAGTGGGTSRQLPGVPEAAPNGQRQRTASCRAAFEGDQSPVLLSPPEANVSVCKAALFLTHRQTGRSLTHPQMCQDVACGHGQTPPFPQLFQIDA